MAIDERSERNIATLHPELQPLARALIERAVAAGINAKVISGLRTYEEQNELYAQGRTEPGKIVTKARGGQSWHNFGTAFDIGIFSKDGKTYYGESEAYKEVGRLGEELGLEWGGGWKFVDEPHFQLRLGLSISDLHRRKSEGLDVVTGKSA
jgi:peptidoglycan L-alanyl-D-glutamate endopeptidase CwlK